MAYNKVDNTSQGAEGTNSDTSNEGEASSSSFRRELSVLPSAVRTVDSPFGKVCYIGHFIHKWVTLTAYGHFIHKWVTLTA